MKTETKAKANATTPARKRGSSRKRRGRSIILALLAGFVVVASAVIWRRTYGITQARRLADLDRTLVQLEAERARLSGQIRDESSRGQIGPVVEQLGMRVPDDRQVRIISR